MLRRVGLEGHAVRGDVLFALPRLELPHCEAACFPSNYGGGGSSGGPAFLLIAVAVAAGSGGGGSDIGPQRLELKVGKEIRVKREGRTHRVRLG